ncbi:MAG TPA: polysaccharide biosynthesis/export family protein [Puia sp.]|nr:polysaccharide biosynthesis/export family protein [Puia sp.]
MRLLLLSRKLTGVFLPLLMILTVMLSSCGTTRPYVYMQGQFDTAQLSQVRIVEPIIQKGDLLNIIVYSDDPEATKIFNQPLIANASSTTTSGSSVNAEVTQANLGNSPTTPGYLVDENGNIEYQILNKLHVEGLTRSQLKDTLVAKLSHYLNNPYCTVRFLNFRFTMLGEIARPALYSIPSDRINIFEALALSGDITLYGRRENVSIIRENNGVREFGRIDLTKPEVINSPYFYLQQNDIVYIEQNKKKSIANDVVTLRNISIATAIVSTVALIYSILK